MYGGALDALKKEAAEKRAMEAKDKKEKKKKDKKKDKKEKKRRRDIPPEDSSNGKNISVHSSASPSSKKRKPSTNTNELPHTNTERPQPGEEGFAKTQSIEYLRKWENDRSSWKFNKNRQVWLLQNMFHPSSVDRSSFKILLKYLEGLKGASRTTTLKQAQSILEEGLDVQNGVEVEGLDHKTVEKAFLATQKLRRIRFGRADALARILA
jgi:hypothetical protein